MAATKTKLLRVEAISEEYGFTLRQIRRFITEKKWAVIKPSGPKGPVFVEREEIDRFIEQHRIPAER
ncbi:hypothetical protein [Kribbella italica]|uniref:Helix-turn-helix domain-containing protein n=1 Tax=Kribbella italica TaxID=1540520 RepID=A0A7W9J8W4_9ACTN|nr:hypothetical protein [Kribbella italica]MBB5837761.1 hypothetical protein [Kribbella italica]